MELSAQVWESLGAKLEGLELTGEERAALEAVVAAATGGEVSGFVKDGLGFGDRLRVGFTATDDLPLQQPSRPGDRRIIFFEELDSV